jgi:ABC-type transport system involved in multi-copper enzyme maturation permease subunit
MAIYDQSYAPWTGTYSSRAARVRAMIAMELAQPFKNIWLLIIVLMTFSIVAGWLFVLFFVSSYQIPPFFAVGNRIYREGFYNVQFFSLILMVLSGTVGASLIARDVRHRSLLMYFSRSISRVDYLAGKFLSLVLFLLIVTLGPGLLLFFGLLGMGQEKLTFVQRMGDLGAITLHSLILALPMSAAVLAFSSLTKRTYVAAILWTTFYFASITLSQVLTATLKAEWPKMLSWTNLTAHLGDLCYPARNPTPPLLECGWGPPLLILGSITLLSLAIVWRRLRSVEGEE